MATSKNEIGNKGEVLARTYLEEKGYTFLEANYRYKRAEVDIIMTDGACLVFVEVKWRKNSKFGFPESFVSDRKIELYHEAAEHYTFQENWNGPIRFDVVALLKQGNDAVIEHFSDAFS